MEAVYHMALSKPFVESIAWANLADINQTGLTVLAERALPEEEITQEILDREILQAEMAYDSTNDPAAKHAAEAAVGSGTG